ncbi:MAG: DUF4112 domain-containing protein [Woeseiaceae bacterium]
MTDPQQTDDPARPIVTREVPRHLKRLSHFLDNSIRLPGGYRIGWDGVIGLIPGVGDIAGLVLSLYIISQAARLNVAKSSLIRMFANVGIETVIGAIPLVGDLFDFGFKANVRNLALIDAHVAQPVKTTRTSRLLVLLLLAIGTIAFLLLIWLVVFIVQAAISLF